MKLAIIGSDNIGKSIGAWAAKVGYEVIIPAKNEQLKAARNPEPMELMNIAFGYGLGHGTSIGFSFFR